MQSDIFVTPTPDDADLRVLAMIEELRRELARYVGHRPRRWAGHLRRMSFARAIRGSNWIEGYRASLDDVLNVVDGEDPLNAEEQTALALAGCRDAMSYILQLAAASETRIDESLLKSLHYMMVKHDLRVQPGLYRDRDVWVAESDGTVVYEAPPPDRVDVLMSALAKSLAESGDLPVMFAAAMAHLNLVMIHPFRDGNGRMGRALQTMVLAREGIVSPVYSSVEEYLGRNTADYYAVLSEVGEGAWHPENSARPWIRFMLTAHYRQAWTLRQRVFETEQLHDSVTQLVARRRMPRRAVGPLTDAARGRPLRRSLYMHLVRIADGDPISELTASRDLKSLCDAGILEPQGAGRGRTYLGSQELQGLRQDARASRPPTSENDPYATAP